MSGELLNAEGPRSPTPGPPPPPRSHPASRLLLDACSVSPSAPPAPSASLSAPFSAPSAPFSAPSACSYWPWLLAVAQDHAVTPLLARYLAARPNSAPPEILAALRARFDENALRNVALTRHLAELLQRLAANGVTAMPIKGPVLALVAYGDLALREFRDLDILVHPSHFDRARTLLGKWGYLPLTALTGAGERALHASDHHLPLVSRDGMVKVELHWTLGRGRLGRDDAWVWSNLRPPPSHPPAPGPASILGVDAPTLSWSALLVYLCAHGAAHCWTRLGWVRDVAGVLLAAPEGELREAAGLAAAASSRRRLALGVALAHELLGAPVPAELESNQDRAVELLVRQLSSTLFARDESGIAGWMAFQCRSRENLLDRAGYCLHVLAAPHVADVEAVPLPTWLRGMYYVVRPARLALGRGRAMWPGSSRS